MPQKVFITTLLCSLFCYISSMAAPIERDIVINHDGVSLPGTLTLPDNVEGHVPVVVMVQGSGPADRDETIGPNKPLPSWLSDLPTWVLPPFATISAPKCMVPEQPR